MHVEKLVLLIKINPTIVRMILKDMKKIEIIFVFEESF